ncbi:uncharacterized protein ACA1_185160 [Acanthamoeba castellanii str. Neff]|uniref:Uncharacterized protein n=1 Tax=Acanthamoeba castellanii (strain ATCC 30010 / Neff) TaxID=1257118 RepID=L8H6F6_ACACF|nr:uncharacterized protein ACA1_185160 [Acanthamoeba castellanii str. Neff]ELR20333.1 hypothetical protein ACA1_185160 [Acanthamoeba castellanii str. Neff]
MKWSTVLVAVVLLAFLCGAMAIRKPSFRKGKSFAPATQMDKMSAMSKKRPTQEASEEMLDQCLASLKQSVRDESEWEEERDECLARLAPLVEEDRLNEWYRDQNRSLAIGCLLNLTQCNDDNEALLTREIGPRRETDESIVKHPYVAKENRLRKRMHEFDETVFLGMSKPASRATRQRRETIQCSLDRCETLVTESLWEIEQLKKNVSWCEREIVRRKASIMSYLRFAMLYEQETAVCEPIWNRCRNGARLVKLTITNAPVAGLLYQFDLQSGWAGFANRSTSIIPETVPARLEFLQALGDLADDFNTTVLDTIFARNSEGAVTGPVGDGGVLCGSQSFSALFEVWPEANGFLFVGFPVVETEEDSVTVLGAISSIQVFDGNNNFITRDLPIRELDKKKKLAKIMTAAKAKRGPDRQNIEDCGCVGDALPHFERHLSLVALSDVRTYQLVPPYPTESQVIEGGAALLSLEELRWTVPYPPGIRPEVVDIPSEYPLADTL